MNLLVTPTEGRVRSPERGILEGTIKIRAHRQDTGMVFQQHQLIARQSALANVLTARLARYGTIRSLFPLPKSDRQLALSCLDQVGLLEKALQRVDQLSGGQQQRVGVARALAMEPHLILADEPVASLDPATSEELLTLLRKVCRDSGITLVISLHQVEYARQFGDRIIALSRGDVVFDGPSEALKDNVVEMIYLGEKDEAESSQDPDSAGDQPTETEESRTMAGSA